MANSNQIAIGILKAYGILMLISLIIVIIMCICLYTLNATIIRSLPTPPKLH